MQSPCGYAVDLGTTTVSVTKICGTQKTLSFANPQSRFGSDLLSRISACPSSLVEQQRLITNAIASAIEALGAPREGYTALCISGNAVMLHILLGIDPSPLGVLPFTPAWQGSRRLSPPPEFSRLGICELILPPAASAFIGADIISGLLSLEHSLSPASPYLFADLGTNAELCLSLGDIIYTASAAAGPALEGGGIECGGAALQGAVDHVGFDSRLGCLSLTTIGGAPATSICGSGLIDTLALLRRHLLITPSGELSPNPDSPLSARIKGECFYLTDTIYLSAADIRASQLAKAAIRAGIDTLLERAGTDITELAALYLAGGLGEGITPSSAAQIGLLPPAPTVGVGNTSLAGAALCLEDKNLFRAEAIASRCRLTTLGGNPKFSQKFIQNINFSLEES